MSSSAGTRRFAALALVATLLVSGIAAAAAPAALAAEATTSAGTASVTRDGMRMLPFRKVMQEAGASVWFDSAAQEFYVEIDGLDITLPVYGGYAVVDGQTVKLSRAPVVVQGVAYIPEDFIEGVLSGDYAGWRWNDRWYDRWFGRKRVVALDPGHTWTQSKDGLQFKLTYKNGSPERIGLMVKNATSEDKTLTFPSGKTHEIVILRYGQKVWGSADGKFYTQAVQNVVLKAGETKTYWSDIPRLASGAYSVRGYLTAVSSSKPVVRANLSVKYTGYGRAPTWYDPLEYTLSFRQKSLFGANPPSLMLTVKNPTNDEVIFPDTHTYAFVIWGTDGSVTRKELPAMSRSEFVQKMAAGALQQHFIYLKGLPAGEYYAEGYVKEGGEVIRTIGGIRFTIR
ncbi:MAG: hypothetical protein HPY55_02545 [Firmicutes bacterium]|nr:hypothetical protein [Bacillota bacterium]